ncbi:TonB-dependent receptor domain-containing protein [Sphingobacterium zeae]|uniref:TonB-dependent receptor domain-containing protein n=1 Tax=Sphingobacterium zeae TaxID=1776859 RepID=UPI0036110865
MSDRQSIFLNDIFNTFKRQGSDEVNPQNANYEKSKLSQKNILALGYQYDVKDRYSINAFLKHYNQHNVSGAGEIKKDLSKIGYGMAVSYFINTALQLKGSYELTTKMPTPEELFGDVINYEGNYNLKPEKSNNYNLGILYSFHLNMDHRFALMANGFFRNADDFIYQRLNNNQTLYISDNRDGVQSIGGDLDLRYSFRRWFNAGLNVTYQKVKNLQKVEPGYTGLSPLYKFEMPNIPNTFGNVDASVTLHDFGGKANQLSFGASMLFVRQFWMYWPGLGLTDKEAKKLQIPEQISFDANIVYAIHNGRYNIAIEGKNLTDKRLVDNFSLQKPSRGFYINLRYFFNK